MNLVTSVISIGLIILAGLDILTSMARAGCRSATRSRLHQLNGDVSEGHPVVSVMSNIPKSLASLHLFQAIVRFVLAGGVIYLSYSFQLARNVWIYALILVIFAIVLATIEWIFSRIAANAPEQWCNILAWFVRAVTIILTPLVWLTLMLSKESPDVSGGLVSLEEEVMTLVDAGEQEGELEQEERKMIHSIFQLGDTLTREIMVPRIDMLALDANTSTLEAVDLLLESGYSRVPVYEETIDNIIGVLYAKDLLRLWRKSGDSIGDLRELVREAYFVPEAKPAIDLLAELQSRRVHLAIVVDEYGGVAGLVTLEDIVEEIFGEIQDEYDVEEMPYQILEDGDYLFQGRVDLDDFNELMNTQLPKDEADTISGFIYRQLGHVPVAGESVEAHGVLLTVEQVSNRRIRKVRAHRLPQESELNDHR